MVVTTRRVVVARGLQVLSELVADDTLARDHTLARFRKEYEKLHSALSKSHQSESRLIQKCRDLNSEIVSNAAKVQAALKLSQGDQQTINALKGDIEQASRANKSHASLTQVSHTFV